MKKRGRRCLISLLLGLCLLMPSQMNVLAADAQEDSSSVQAVEEAVPDRENATTIDENQTENQTDNQIDNTMQDDQDIAVLADNYPATGKITAKIYLRYSNAIPKDINQDFGMDEFGPSGNNTPYFTVTVDLDQLNKKPVKTYVKKYGQTWYIYYSIDSDESWNPGDKADANRVQNATNLWEQAILQAMSSTDQKKFENVFGSNMFVGYVLKRENDGWHIDGILKKDPPVYVVELYDQNDQALFAISSNEQKLPGVTYADFKAKVEEAIEKYSVLRSYMAVDRSDVCVIVIDATEGFTEQDSKVAGYAHEQGKGCIIAVNKWDAVEKDDKTMDSNCC